MKPGGAGAGVGGGSGPPKEIRVTLAHVRAPAMRASAGTGEEPFAFAAREALRERTIGCAVQFVVEYTVPQLPGRYFGTVFVDPAHARSDAVGEEEGGELAQAAQAALSLEGDAQSATASARKPPKVSVTRELVRAGLLRVKDRGGDGGSGGFGGDVRGASESAAPSAAAVELDVLRELEQLAAAEQLGVHGPASAGVRALAPAAPSAQLLHELKGRTLSGIVEYCITGSVYKVSLCERGGGSAGTGHDVRWRSISVQLAGTQSPGFRREPGAPADAPAAPMPFALNARFVAESRLLHREVAFVVEHGDRVGGPPDAPLYVRVVHVKRVAGALPTAPPEDIAEALLLMGFAKTIPHSLAEIPTNHATRLRMAEKAARDARRGVWRDFRGSEMNAPINAALAASSSSSGSSAGTLLARVQEIVSGDTLALVVESGAMSGSALRVFLASIRAPRLARPGGGGTDEPYAYDAREFLRKSLIGQRVRVQIVYQKVSGGAAGSGTGSQAAQQSPAASAAANANAMLFASVYCEGKSASTTAAGGTAEANGGSSGNGEKFGVDVAEMLVRAGLATVVKHRSGDDTALDYDALVAAEKEAQDARKGVHKLISVASSAAGGVPAGVRRINDLTAVDAKKRARDMLAFLEKAGAMSGIVEHASSGSRFRVYIPKDRMLLAVALRAVRSPAPSRRAGSQTADAGAEQGEPGGDFALAFARDTLLQRDVQLEVFGIDRNSTFLVDMWLVGSSAKDAAEMLLEGGAARFHETKESNPRTPRYVAAEKRAVSSARGLWALSSNGSAAATSASATANPSAASSASGSGLGGIDPPARSRVRVVEVGVGGRIFYRELSAEAKQRIATVERALAELPVDAETAANNVVPLASVKLGEVLAVRFSNGWFRAKVLRKSAPNDQLLVRFLDYGTEEWVSSRSAARFPVGSPAPAVPQLALETRLAGIVVAGGAAPDAAMDARLSAEGGYDDGAYAPEALEMMRTELLSAPWVELLRVGRVASGGSGGGGSGGAALVLSEIRTAESVLSDGVDSSEVSELSVNQKLLRAGLARVLRRKDELGRAAAAQYAADERAAREAHLRIWRYGDPYASDEDQPAAAPSSRRAP